MEGLSYDELHRIETLDKNIIEFFIEQLEKCKDNNEHIEELINACWLELERREDIYERSG